VNNHHLVALESLFNPFSLEKHPIEVFLVGFFYTIIALALAYLVFAEVSGIIMVFLVVIATLPMMYSLIKREVSFGTHNKSPMRMLKGHTHLLFYLTLLFLGIMAALLVAYIFLPQPIVNLMFSLQQAAVSGVSLPGETQVSAFNYFGAVLANNIKVLFFCLLFSFLYGTGALFILTWNASVIATAIGGLMKEQIGVAATSLGWPIIGTYFSAATFSFFRYMTHGLFEIVAYFTAGLAGGIISIAFIKHKLRKKEIIIDALDLVLLSIGLLVVGAIVEAFVTPLLF
jgi:uncharacterized membrane protein SpoIIM required for sporulation